MNITLKLFFLLSAILVFTACQPTKKVFVQTETVTINESIQKDPELSRMLGPYKDSLKKEMKEVIGFTPSTLERARPEGALGNFMTDETLEYMKTTKFIDTSKTVICMMNHGGLRAPINAGPIKVEDIYKLMPFDNTIVVCKASSDLVAEMVDYIHIKGGEPIGGFRIEGKDYVFNDSKKSDTIQIITTNYLANGGDNMHFFEKCQNKTSTGILLRSLLIEQVKKKNEIMPTLDGRINLETDE